MLQTLLFFNIAVPLLTGVGCYLFKSSKIRTTAIILTGVSLIMSSLLLLMNGSFTYEPEALWGVKIGTVIEYAEFILLAIILYISYKLRNPIVGLLTIVQIVCAIYFGFYLAHGVEVEPAFYADQLSIIMDLLVSIVGSLICLFAIPYMKEYEEHHHVETSKQPRFFFFILIFLGAMNALVLTNNLKWMYLFWEITTLCSFMLIGHDRTKIAIKNATRAITLNMLGGVAFAFAIILIYQYEGTLSIQEIISNGISTSQLVLIPLAFLCLAGFTKSAQVPFQSWLLGAMVAPTPVSALLHSSTMVKAGVYLVLRFAPAYAGTELSTFVAIFGAFTFVVTSALAISQSNGKKILAYSTIANLGLIVTCAGINTPLAIAAAIILIIFHGISKALLFLCVGTIEHGIGSRDLEDMHGLIAKMPLTAVISVIGMITMLLPPFGMLIGKWGTLEAAANMPIVMLLLVLGSALTVVFWLRWSGILLSSTYVPNKKLEFEEQSVLTRFPLITLAIGAIVCSLSIITIFKKLMIPFIMNYYPNTIFAEQGFTIMILPNGVFPLLAIFGTLALAIVAALIFMRNAKTDLVTAPYLCGESGTDCTVTDFCSVEDKWEKCHSSNYYLESVFGENKLTVPSNIFAILIVIAMFGVIMI